jgi:hypothetical protein
MFKNKIPTNWIHACGKNCCRPSKSGTSDERNKEGRVSPTVTVTTTTMTEMELPDRIVHPYRYVEEATSNDTEI